MMDWPTHHEPTVADLEMAASRKVRNLVDACLQHLATSLCHAPGIEGALVALGYWPGERP